MSECADTSSSLWSVIDTIWDWFLNSLIHSEELSRAYDCPSVFWLYCVINFFKAVTTCSELMKIIRLLSLWKVWKISSCFTCRVKETLQGLCCVVSVSAVPTDIVTWVAESMGRAWQTKRPEYPQRAERGYLWSPTTWVIFSDMLHICVQVFPCVAHTPISQSSSCKRITQRADMVFCQSLKMKRKVAHSSG